MKRFFITIFCVFAFLFPVNAQRSGLYLSGGIEANGIVSERLMLAFPSLFFEGRLFRYFSVGLKGIASVVDIETIFSDNPMGYYVSIEALLALRLYPFAPAAAPESKKLLLEPFVEFSSGLLVGMVLYEGDSFSSNAAEVGGSAGVRLLLGPSVFLEPYFRTGIPLVEEPKPFFGGGLVFGGRLGKAPPPKPPAAASATAAAQPVPYTPPSVNFTAPSVENTLDAPSFSLTDLAPPYGTTTPQTASQPQTSV